MKMLLEDTRPYKDRHPSECPFCLSVNRAWPGEYCYHHHKDRGIRSTYELIYVPNLYFLRNEKDLNIQQLADLAMVSADTVTRLERGYGQCRRSTALSLAEGLEVSLSDLTGEEE